MTSRLDTFSTPRVLGQITSNGKAKSVVLLLENQPDATGNCPVIETDEVNLKNVRDRSRFVDSLAAKLDENDRAAIARELDGIAAKHASEKAAHGDGESNAAPQQGRVVTLEMPEPWRDDVNGAEVLAALASLFLTFCVLAVGAADALALWVLHTWAHDSARVSPILAITAPQKQCGKTRVLDVLLGVVRRPLCMANISGAALFRVIEKYCPTVLIDEGDTFLKDREDLRGLLNSGHTRTSAKVYRTVGESQSLDVHEFSTWAPKAIAQIGQLADTLHDRAIVIPMRRRDPRRETVAEMRQDLFPDQCIDLRRRALRWAIDHSEHLAASNPVMLDELGDRAKDNWRPLFAIADVAGGDWPARARAAALALLAGRGEDPSIDVQLLSDIRDVFTERGTDRISSDDLVRALNAIEGRPWADWSHGKGLTANALARRLKGFDVKPTTVRIDARTPKGYVLTAFDDAFTRYAPAPPLTTATTATTKQNNELRNYPTATSADHVAVANPPNSLRDNGVAVVAVAGPPPPARMRMTAHGPRPFDGDRPVDGARGRQP